MVVSKANRDDRVVEGFGEEWSRFPQGSLSEAARVAIFNDYFSIFPWNELPPHASGADIGCGSGRWAACVAPLVGKLICIDISEKALDVARANLAVEANVDFCLADVGCLPFADGELDFAYSLGVLHHVPDTGRAIKSIAAKLKPGAPFLLYLYYDFDNRPWWFRMIWTLSDGMRMVISKTPSKIRFFCCDLIAACVYWPLARIARSLEQRKIPAPNFPLAYYRDKSFYVMRTDALDRFGTRLEKRFQRNEIAIMLENAGFSRIKFADHAPHWCAVAHKE